MTACWLPSYDPGSDVLLRCLGSDECGLSGDRWSSGAERVGEGDGDLGPWLALARALLTKALALEAAVGAASAAAAALLLVPACRDNQLDGFSMTTKARDCAAAIQLFKRAQYNQWPLFCAALQCHCRAPGQQDHHDFGLQHQPD